MARSGELTSLQSLLEHYKQRLVAPEATVLAAAMRAIELECGVVITKHQVTYNVHTKTLYLQVPSVLRQSIIKKHHVILSHIKADCGVKNSPTSIQ